MNTNASQAPASVKIDGKPLSEMEVAALDFVMSHGGSVLVTAIPDKTESGLFGEKVPGMPIYKKLEKRGLLVLTEEEVEEDGFQYTPTAETTEAGEALWRQLKGQAVKPSRPAGQAK